MAGGGDLGGLGGDAGGGGGKSGGGGSPGGSFPGSPDMTGLGGPGGDMGFGGPPMDTGNVYNDPGGPGAPGGGTFANFDPYSSDPNVGAPQSQAPTPGATPASIGGTQSGSQAGYPGGNQGYGGGALPSQLQQQVQKLVEQLTKQTSTQPTFGQGSPQSTFANQQYPQPAQSTFPPGRQDDVIQQPFPPGRRDDTIQQPFPPGRQDAPSPSAPFPTGRRDAPTPYAGPGGGYGGGQTFGDTIEPADQSILPAAEAQQRAPQAPQLPSPQATHGAVPWGDSPQEATGTATDHPAAGDPAATAATTPTAATAPTTPPAAPESPSTTSPGQPAPASAEMFNPFRALSDILTGNFSDLQHMKGGTPAQAAGPGYGPGTRPTQDTGTTPPTATEPQVAGPPTAGSQVVNSKPGAPDAKPDAPDDGFKAQRQEWYKTHDRADPFPHDVGQGYQGGPLAGRPDTPGAAQPGQQGVPERGSYPQLQTRMAPGRQMGPVNPGLQDTMAAAASQFEANNPGYKVQVNSGARGSNDPHGRHNAVDMQIIGPDGQPIKNSGADRTGKYAELANNALAAQRALHPELNGKFMWGGYFNAAGGHGLADPSTGNNHPDLMHFDVEGNKSYRTLMRDRYYSTFRQGPQGQQAQQPASVGPQQQMGFTSSQEAQSYRSTVAQIESSGNRFNRTGNQYGLYQFSPDQFRRLGITDWTNVDQQNRALGNETNENRTVFSNAMGRQPTGPELYMMHQQGVAGAMAHFRNPNGSAVANIQQYYRPGVAAQAIRNNIPRDDPLRNVPVNQITSKQFTDMWQRKYDRFGGQQAPAQAQQPQAPTVQQPRIPAPVQLSNRMASADNLANRYGMDWV